MSNNEISIDDKEKLVKYIYDNKGYLLLTYDEHEKEFVYDRVMDELLIKAAIKNIKKKKNNVQGTKVSSSQPPENWEEGILAELTPPLERTQSLPSDMNLSDFITKAQERYLKIEEKVKKLYPHNLVPRPSQLKLSEEARKVADRMKHTQKTSLGPKAPLSKKGGKTRRKIRRNKKAKTKKRKTNKKTKKRKANKKTKVNRKKSKKRRTKK